MSTVAQIVTKWVEENSDKIFYKVKRKAPAYKETFGMACVKNFPVIGVLEIPQTRIDRKFKLLNYGNEVKFSPLEASEFAARLLENLNNAYPNVAFFFKQNAGEIIYLAFSEKEEGGA